MDEQKPDSELEKDLEGLAEEVEKDEASWEEAFKGEQEARERKEAKEERKKAIEKPEFAPLKEEEVVVQPRNLEFILDIPLEVTAELGRTKMLIDDLLRLGQGSIIELEKLAGEPVEILVSGRLIARGEVVVVNERFGIRLTDIVSPSERVRRLG